ncbi:hypothetical protein MYXO_02328 [Myxococcaceae bacterium]|jgi:hypothetical protein|nr:hypothetical protein MYXO_02328 [Myxococcaceae bacterium]
MPSAHAPTEELLALLRGGVVKSHEVARLLDALPGADRVLAIRALGRSEQRRLYEAAGGVSRVQLVDLVPPATPDLVAVRHYGRNTLPAFTLFEKRFARPKGEDPNAPKRLAGWNFQTLSPLTGPGYFVARNDEARGEVLIDYREVPTQAPEGWPPIVSNDRGLGRFVYGNMVDTLRRVSEHVTIGSAARGGKDLGSWFVLCRES